MQSTASYLEFKLNVNLRLVKPDFLQSTAVNLEFKLKVIFKLLSCNRPVMFKWYKHLHYEAYPPIYCMTLVYMKSVDPDLLEQPDPGLYCFIYPFKPN